MNDFEVRDFVGEKKLNDNVINTVKKEIDFLTNDFNLIINTNSLEKEFLNFIDSKRNKKTSLDKIPIKSVCNYECRNFNKYLLINNKTFFVRQIFSLFIRSINKFIFKFNKVLPRTGHIIVLYGTDGSGKTSISNNIINSFCKIIPVSKAHLGKPFVGNNFIRKYLYKGNKFRNERGKNNNQNIILSILKTTILSSLRLFSSYYQVLKKNLGILVISDRWPSMNQSLMDGPRIYPSKRFRFFVQFFNNLNLNIYKLIPKADLIIYLDVNLNIILDRNKKRLDSEPEIFIKKRFNNIQEAKPKAKQIIKYKNNKDLENATNDCIKIITKFIETQ